MSFPIMLTFDLDAESGALAVDPTNARRPGVLSVGQYGPKVGVHRILRLLADESADGEIVRALIGSGHDVLLLTREQRGMPDPQVLALRTQVNVMQDSSTAEMLFGVAELLAFCSRRFTLEPGDLLLSGTPY